MAIRDMGGGTWASDSNPGEVFYSSQAASEADNKGSGGGEKKTGKGNAAPALMLICIVVFLHYWSGFAATALLDYGYNISYWLIFLPALVLFVPVNVFIIVKAGNESKIFNFVLILNIIFFASSVAMGGWKILQGEDLVYGWVLDAKEGKIGDYKRTTIKGSAALRSTSAANSGVLKNLKEGEAVHAIGVTDTGAVLIRYNDGNKRIRGWIKSENINLDSKTLTILKPASVVSNTLNVRYYPKPEGLRNDTIDKTYNVVVAGNQVNGWYPVYTWTEKYMLRGYVPADCIFINDGSGAKAPARPPSPEGKRARVTVDSVMYDKPHFIKKNRNKFKAKEVKKGDTVIVLDERPKDLKEYSVYDEYDTLRIMPVVWRRVWFDGEIGWINEAYPKEKGGWELSGALDFQ